MQIIDAQVHIWGSGTPSAHHRQVSRFPAEELIGEMDAAGVDGADLPRRGGRRPATHDFVMPQAVHPHAAAKPAPQRAIRSA